MIPKFPNFIKLKPRHGSTIKKLTQNLPGYSDYNSVSLLAWNTNEDTLVSLLSGNLVVIFTDYTSDERLISLHGTHNIPGCVAKIFKYANANGLTPKLELVPEETVMQIPPTKRYVISADRNNYDYVISVDNVSKLHGRKFRNARRQANDFSRNYEQDTSYVALDFGNTVHTSEILSVFTSRESQKPSNEEHSELTAIQRLMQYHSLFDVHARGLRINGALQAFIIIEKTQTELVGHFWKANTSYKGIYHYLLRNCCEEFSRLGYDIMNIEQDLGLSGLRTAKTLLCPVFLRKYSIKPAPEPQPIATQLALQF